MSAVVKTVGSSGQFYLGKEYAGKLILVEEIEPGTWMLRTGEFMPDSERLRLEAGMKQVQDHAQ